GKEKRRSTDFGATWLVHDEPDFAPRLRRLVAPTVSDEWIKVYKDKLWSLGAGKLRVSPLGATTWTAVKDSIKDLFVSAGNNLFVLRSNGLYKSSDGANWALVNDSLRA